MYENLLDVCITDNQREVVKTLCKVDTQAEAAKILGKNIRTIQRTIRTLRTRAEVYGKTSHYLEDINIPNHLPVHGTSTLVKTKDGLQWIKTKASDQARFLLMQSAIEALTEDLPKIKINEYKRPNDLIEDLLNDFTLTDTHIGDLAFKSQNGESDWNLEVADKTICETMTTLAEESPRAETAVLRLLGDILHFDHGIYAETPHSRHSLDSCGSYSVIAPVAVAIVRRVIEILLRYHNKLKIIVVRGNHDEATTVLLKVIIQMIADSHDRIELINGRIDFHAFLFGTVMNCSYHGDKIKTKDLPLIFATEYPEMWGKAKHIVINCGDKHHHKSEDISKVFVIQHETMDARNRYTTGKGLFSARGATRYTYHKIKGRKGWGHESILN